MPKSKHRRKGKTYPRPPRTQRKATAAVSERGEDEVFRNLIASVHLVTERCELLYGPAPDDGWGRDRILAAARQLEDDGIISRDLDPPYSATTRAR
ncbi:MAG TPA: hypothetical protein VKF42_11355 [Chitinivibrionales bacterium]|nr:hypothetical protein [Chitinivibrionales bacterium]